MNVYWPAGRKYPFYGVQWHPEVNRFQWDPRYIFPHSSNAVRVSSLLAEFFVNEGNCSLILYLLMCLLVPHLDEFGWTNACVCFQEGEAPTTSVKQQKRAARSYTPTTLCMWQIPLRMNCLISSERHNIEGHWERQRKKTLFRQMDCNRPHHWPHLILGMLF